MVHLIITLISISLLSALALATVNYMPWHVRPAAEVSSVARESLTKVESAYQVAVALNNGVSPSAAGTPQEAFNTVLVEPLLKFTPAAPTGYGWSYAQFSDTAQPGSVYDGLHYVCLYPLDANRTSDMALERGFGQGLAAFSPAQVTLSETCGAKTSLTSFAKAPVVTMFLVPAPEFSY